MNYNIYENNCNCYLEFSDMSAFKPWGSSEVSVSYAPDATLWEWLFKSK